MPQLSQAQHPQLVLLLSDMLQGQLGTDQRANREVLVNVLRHRAQITHPSYAHLTFDRLPTRPFIRSPLWLMDPLEVRYSLMVPPSPVCSMDTRIPHLDRAGQTCVAVIDVRFIFTGILIYRARWIRPMAWLQIHWNPPTCLPSYAPSCCPCSHCEARLCRDWNSCVRTKHSQLLYNRVSSREGYRYLAQGLQGKERRVG